ncbi:MAG: Crp/Fnr family transcriptional regulator [Gammaproteobacteria bacterium]
MNQRPVDIPGVLSRLPIFSAAGSDAIDAIAAGTQERRLANGEVLFRRGDMPRGFFVVVYGQVKLVIESTRGAEKVIDLLATQQSFGEAVMFMDRPYPVTAQALTGTLVLHIAREPVFALLERDPMFARRMLAGLSQRLHALVQDVESYSLRSCAERFIGWLLQSAGGEDAGAAGEVEIILPTARHVIASRLNLTPETLSRVQHDLIDAGLIEVRGRSIVISDLRRLREYRP